LLVVCGSKVVQVGHVINTLGLRLGVG